MKQNDFRDDFRSLILAVVPPLVEPSRIEIWFQDEARAGQKGMLSRIRAAKGSLPRVVRDDRYGCAWLFASTRGENPAAVGHVCARANTSRMNSHLADISQAVLPGNHGVIVLDGAGWHRPKDLVIPDNLTVLHSPPYSPELNPVGLPVQPHLPHRPGRPHRVVRKLGEIQFGCDGDCFHHTAIVGQNHR